MSAIADGAASAPTQRSLWGDRKLVRTWLWCVVAFLVAIVIVGGATRLTESGLSITEWKPIHGVIPPLNEADWQEEFAKYREIPQYTQLNAGMSLDQFKTIFWWEWAHRALARLIGVVFAVPLIAFWVMGRIEPKVKPKLLGILALGALQGGIGWWMVASGLVNRVDVSQYRLATHLTVAALIFAATVIVARGLSPHTARPASLSTRRFAGWLVIASIVQIYLGGLVAGLDGGLSYNTWPLMDGRLIPGDMGIIEPFWRNFFENPKTVQFVHRSGAYALLALSLWHMIAARRADPATPHALRALILFHLVLLQAAIGIVTLVLVVPIGWALMHQAGALLVLGFAAAHWRGTRGAYAVEPNAARG
ncbi:MAG: heme A synthase [Mesorhizobium amorphae]|nr:MAG: heme A synthase [Mesorhizobium amorphae]